jgi:hypothetical protein
VCQEKVVVFAASRESRVPSIEAGRSRLRAHSGIVRTGCHKE